MDALAAATATAAAVSTVGSHFMLDGKTYAAGRRARLRRASTSTSPAAAACSGTSTPTSSAPPSPSSSPAHVRTPVGAGPRGHAAGRGGRRRSRRAAHAWAEAHVPDDLDAARLAELAGQVVADGPPGLRHRVRRLAGPAGARPSPKAAAVHQLNALRELRLGPARRRRDRRRPHPARRPCR